MPGLGQRALRIQDERRELLAAIDRGPIERRRRLFSREGVVEGAGIVNGLNDELRMILAHVDCRGRDGGDFVQVGLAEALDLGLGKLAKV